MRFATAGFLVLFALIITGCPAPQPQAPDSSKAITAFDFAASVAPGAVTESNHTVSITVTHGTALTALAPVITHTGAGISPDSGVARDFTNPVAYTVTAADGSTEIYTVTVYKAVPLVQTMQTVSRAVGDDGDTQIGTAWPATRFTANTANTMLDNLTGLVWIQAPDTTQRTWAAALAYADTYAVDSLTDWRLPNVNELESMNHSGVAFPSMPPDWLNANGFTGIQLGYYWTSTTYAADTNCALYVENNMRLGKILKTNATPYTWLVRGDAVNIAQTGQTTSYAAGDDGDLEKGCAIPPSDRFYAIGNRVTDRITGLIWERVPVNATRVWSAAVTYANDLPLDGFSDWRLPNKKELRSLLNYAQIDFISYLTAAGFSNLQAGLYWTSTYYESSGGSKAYVVDFADVSTIGIGAVNNNDWIGPAYVIVVRGGI